MIGLKRISFIVIALTSLVMGSLFGEEKNSNIIYELGEQYSLGEGISEEVGSSGLNNSLEEEYYSVLIFFSYTFSPTQGFDARVESKEFHEKMNNMYLSLITELSEMNVKICHYAPVISFLVEKNNVSVLEIIEEYDFVDDIYVRDYEYDDVIEESVAIDGTITSSWESKNKDFDGSGIVIGFLDEGIIDKKDEVISSVSYKIRDVWNVFEKVTEHATNVARIAIDEAPGISILSAQAAGHLSAEIEWMIKNDVDIINMSFSQFGTNNDGDVDSSLDISSYSSNDRYIDYIAYTLGIAFVGSAGNRGLTDGYTTIPKMGYNMITVGALSSRTILADYSSYRELLNDKPNLVDFGQHPTVNGSGTSYSSPRVAATIALLFQEFPEFKGRTDLLLSVLTTGASMDGLRENYSDIECSGLEQKVGAGRLDYERCRYILSNMDYLTFVSRMTNRDDIIIRKQIKLNLNDTLRLCLAYTKPTIKPSTEDTFINNIDVYIYFDDVLYKVSAGMINIELIEMVATKSGYFTIEIRQAENRTEDISENCTLSYYIE